MSAASNGLFLWKIGGEAYIHKFPKIILLENE